MHCCLVFTVYSAILSNTAAINESVTALQTFQTYMNELIQSNDQLLLSEIFMLKIIRLKFELDTCLKSLRCSAAQRDNLVDYLTVRNNMMILTEIVDRSSIGFPSHFLFSSDFLSRWRVRWRKYLHLYLSGICCC